MIRALINVDQVQSDALVDVCTRTVGVLGYPVTHSCLLSYQLKHIAPAQTVGCRYVQVRNSVVQEEENSGGNVTLMAERQRIMVAWRIVYEHIKQVLTPGANLILDAGLHYRKVQSMSYSKVSNAI